MESLAPEGGHLTRMACYLLMMLAFVFPLTMKFLWIGFLQLLGRICRNLPLLLVPLFLMMVVLV